MLVCVCSYVSERVCVWGGGGCVCVCVDSCVILVGFCLCAYLIYGERAGGGGGWGMSSDIGLLQGNNYAFKQPCSCS